MNFWRVGICNLKSKSLCSPWIMEFIKILYLHTDYCACVHLSLVMCYSLPSLLPFSSIWFPKKSRKPALERVHRLNKINRMYTSTILFYKPINLHSVSFMEHFFCFYWINAALHWGMLKDVKINIIIFVFIVFIIRMLLHYYVLLTSICRKNFSHVSVSRIVKCLNYYLNNIEANNLWVFLGYK